METIYDWHFNNLDIIDGFVGCKRKFICQKELVLKIQLLTLFNLMDYPMHIDTILELLILYFKGLLLNFYKILYFCP